MNETQTQNVDLITRTYTLFDTGYSNLLIRTDDFYDTKETESVINSEINPIIIGSGETSGNQTMVDGYLRSSNFVSGSTGWDIEADGTAQFNSITLIGGTIKYGKTSFADTTHAGWYIGSEGLYVGAASDTTILKFTIASGAFDLVGTVSSRSTATLAAAIDSSGHFTDANFNTATKAILSDFSFGVSGALQIGTYVNGVSGDLRISPNGILARNSAGTTTFSIDGTTGNAIFSGSLSAATGTFAGSLSAATGTLGALTIDSGGNIKIGQTAYNTGIGFWLGYDGATVKLSLGNSDSESSSLLWNGSYLSFGGSRHNQVEVFGYGGDGDVVISSNTTLTRDMFYENLTVNEGKILSTGGYRIYVKNTLTLNGIIRNNGGNAGNGGDGGVAGSVGTAGSAGAASAGGTLPAGVAGCAGKDGGDGGASGGEDGNAGSSNTGTNCSNACITGTGLGNTGAVGGKGGNSGSGQFSTGGSGGTGGAPGTITTPISYPYNNVLWNNWYYTTTAASLVFFNSRSGTGSGGSGGGGASTSSGDQGGAGGGSGGTGGNGGQIFIAAKIIILGAISYIQANGGSGGNGGAGGNATSSGQGAAGGGGGAGGSGGSGGLIFLVYGSYTNNGTSAPDNLEVDGGTGGTGGAGGNFAGVFAEVGTAGSTGSQGAAGSIYYIQL